MSQHPQDDDAKDVPQLQEAATDALKAKVTPAETETGTRITRVLHNRLRQSEQIVLADSYRFYLGGKPALLLLTVKLSVAMALLCWIIIIMIVPILPRCFAWCNWSMIVIGIAALQVGIHVADFIIASRRFYALTDQRIFFGTFFQPEKVKSYELTDVSKVEVSCPLPKRGDIIVVHFKDQKSVVLVPRGEDVHKLAADIEKHH